MIEKGLSGAMIRNELSGIRFFQEISRSRFALPTNAELEKQGIKFPKKGTGKFDHAWTDREIGHAKIVATSMEQHEVVVGIDLARNFGLSLKEFVSLRISPVKEALDHGYLHIKGKVPLFNTLHA